MILQEGANSAFHEAVGDAVMLGVLSPRHLYRLGILDQKVPKEGTGVYIVFAVYGSVR